MRYKIIPVILTAAVTSLFTLYITDKVRPDHTIGSISTQPPTPVNFARYESSRVSSGTPVDFQPAAEASVQAVVHVKTTKKARTVVATDPRSQFFGDIFGRQEYYIPPQMGAGSGVVISPDGYIVTNNHVVAGTDEVTVTFNSRYTTQAKVVGSDPSTDIALLKIQEQDLPYMEFGNSDNVHLGQWVLAVGYPLTLDATVTAGIVSAKGRSLGINRTQSAHAIESFIQTDAAVNPGNSGGALVNTSGQLIGINSAIASPTGSYAGYSYAIPANLVRKVTDDLKQYGSVQRAFLGIEYRERKSLSRDEIQAIGIDQLDGVLVENVMPGGGAEAAGIKKGDFITKVNGNDIRTEPELLEQIARYKPGDHISLTYVRSGRTQVATVELKNIAGTTAIIRKDTPAKLLGASFRQLSQQEKSKLGVKEGILVTDPGTGMLAAQTQIRKGFVITHVNDKAVRTIEELQQALASYRTVQIAGLYPGQRGKYYYGLNIPEGRH